MTLHMFHMFMLTGYRMVQVDIWWGLRIFALRFDEARLKVDDILAQRIVLRLNRLVIVLQRVKISNLLLELLNISFFTLSEGSL